MKIDTPRNREIRRLRREERMTLEAIGKRFNLSRERVRQIVRGIDALLGEQENGDVSDIRTAGDRENNDAAEHGGRGPGGRD
jgi:transcriptional regulator with XRE-family HTH domain